MLLFIYNLGQPVQTRRRAHREDGYYGDRGGGGTDEHEGRLYIDSDQEPLYYNSRPKNHKEPYSQSSWYDDYNYSKYDHRTSDKKSYQETGYYHSRSSSVKRKDTKGRRPSLERQTTLYDDQFYGDSYYNSGDQQYTDDNRGYYDQYGVYSSDYNYKYGSSGYKYQDDSFDEEDYHSASDYGPTSKRKQPVIKRHSSRHSICDYPDYPGYRPRKSDKPKLLPAIPPTSRIRPSPSLPPTPVRTKPQVPTRRAGSLEHQESTDERYINLYSSDTKLGKNSYNEDYNYAYISSDNLTPDQPVESSVIIVPQDDHIKKRKSNVTPQRQLPQPQRQLPQPQRQLPQPQRQLPQQITKLQQQSPLQQQQKQQQQQQQDYYQDSRRYNDDYYYEKEAVKDTKKSEMTPTLNRRDTLKKQKQSQNRRMDVPPILIQMKSDSIDSPHEDVGMGDSFETAISSVSTSVHKGRYQDDQYTPVNESPPSHTMVQSPTVSQPPKNQTHQQVTHTTMVHQPPAHYQTPSVSSAMPEPVKSSQPTTVQTITTTSVNVSMNGFNGSRNYLHMQESIESYVDEDLAVDDYSRESPISVVDRSETDPQYMSQQERAAMMDQYDIQSPSPPPQSHGKPLSPNRMSPPPQPSLHHQTQSIDDDIIMDSSERLHELHQLHHQSASLEDKAAGVLYEVEEEMLPTQLQQPTERRRMTAKERWLWAYGRIIQQLNVSTILLTYFKILLCT
ncbi:hypothetical protein O3M35_008157 [Rhynocoris fuscipes]|uniref:Uncharacterized protein n=1 Tax=Rhynocoris fuscipes TaxID=488301 RepID=A0AAW1D604_9HEMI